MHASYTKSIAGDIGVWIFFVISGFLITTLLLKEKATTQHISLKHFYIRRFLRIIPVAYLFLIILSIVNHYQKLGIGIVPFTSAALFLQNIPFHNNNWYVEHFWSLSVEEQFYLTFPFLLVYSLNRYIKVIIFLIIFIPIIQYLGFNNVGIFYTNRTVHVITYIIINVLGNSVNILAGSLMSILIFKGIIVVKDFPFSKYLSLILFCITVAICTEGSIFALRNAELLIFPILISSVIMLNLNPNNFFTRILSNKILVYIGVLSYSLYIWQQLFDNSDTWLIKSNSVLVHVVVLFVVANASYYLYEKPFLKLKKRFKSRINFES